MATMTAEGCMLRRWDERPSARVPILIRLGDRVKLFNRMTGVAQCWTEAGVMVRLDKPFKITSRDEGDGLTVLAVDAGDNDISDVVEPIAERTAKGGA